MPEQHLLTLDIGGTTIAGARVRLGGDRPVIERVVTIPTPAPEGPSAVIAAAMDCAQAVLASSPAGSPAVTGIGIASAGVIAPGTSQVTHATDSLPGWAGTDVAHPFQEHFAVPVTVLNDVHAHGLGEDRFGVGAGHDSLLLVAVGTGIGGCIVRDGTPVAGVRGAAGHIGHLSVPEAEGVPCPCGRTGHLEGLAAGPGIVRLAERLGARDVGTGHDLARLAEQGDHAALEAYRVAGHATGRVIGGVLNLLDVDVVALTGGVASAAPIWREALHEGVAADAMDVVAATPVLPAAAGTHAALLGAAAAARDRFRPDGNGRDTEGTGLDSADPHPVN